MSDKDKAIELALSQIEKQFGKGAIMRLGDMPTVKDVKTISTGSIAIDIAIGIGGVPRGRVIEIFGPEACGKTTLSLHIIAEAQKAGGVAAFIDAEHALDSAYAKRIGVNLEGLLVSQPDSGEQALEIYDTLVRSGAVDVIVLDSVAALASKVELEGEMGAAHMGLQARLMSQALRKLTSVISKTKTCAIFINQIREKIGIMFGNPEVTPGGRALKFYTSLRIDMRRIESIKIGQDNIGNRVKVKIVKNKIAPPFKEAEIEIYFGEGISKESSLIEAAVNYNVIEKSGAWFAYKGERIGQGKDNVRSYLKGNPLVLNEIETKVKEKAGIIEEEVKQPAHAEGGKTKKGN
ncbi:MAG: recombinase RecA [Candidatus Firestonebacteria bacterium]